MNKYQISQKLILIAKQILSGGIPINRQTLFFKRLTSIGKRSGRSTYKDQDDYFYQWDSLHGEWQIFNKLGWHEGVLNDEGKRIKNAIKGRKIRL